jgi:hypothetical protein
MRFVLALALAFAGVGCGDDDSGDGTPLTVDDLPTAFRSAHCRYLVACGQFPDRASCLSANHPVLTDGFTFDLEPNLVAAIKAGRVQLDATRVSSCLAMIGGMSCDGTDRDGRNLYKRCWHYTSGTLGAGSQCFLDEECISEDCQGGATTDVCVMGTCVGDTPPSREPAAIGMPCAFDPGCVDEAYCDITDTFTCLPLRGAGELCTSAEQCDIGLACAGDGVGTRSCKPLPMLGEPCPDLMCRDAGTYCADSGVCEAIGLAGASCSGAFLECAWAYPCDTSSGTCERGPGVGEPCAENSIVRCFDAGLVCDSASFTCVAPKDDGKPCTTDAVCKSGRCDAIAGQCAPTMLCR